MQIKGVLALLRSNSLGSLQIMRDLQSSVRLHFLYAAIETGLLQALRTPSSKEALKRKLQVSRPELLQALLDVGLALGELQYKQGLYRVKGRRSLAVVDSRGDTFAAMVQADVTYYNSVYRNLADRLHGAPLGNYLEEIGQIVARLSKISEPVVRFFIEDLVAGKGPIRILDVGCGSAVHLRSAYEANPEAIGVGIDLDETVVEQARKNLDRWGIGDRFHVVAGDVRHPPAALAGPFDLITLYSIIYYFRTEERPDLFRKLRALLSPHGSIAIVSGVQSGGKYLSTANLNAATSSIAGCTPLPTIEEITTLLQESGLDPVKTTQLIPGGALCGIVATSK